MTDQILSLTSYQPSHLAAITAIYEHHVRHGTASFEEVAPTEEEMAGRFDGLLQHDYPLITALDPAGGVIGYAYAGPHKLRSAYRFTVEDSIYVSPDHQRQGIGKALLQGLIEASQDRPYRQMIAVIGDSQNHASIGLHAACGFEMIGTARKVGFKFERWLDVVFMQRSL